MAGKILASLSALLTLDAKGFEKGVKGSKSVLKDFFGALKTAAPAIAGAFSVDAIMNFTKAAVQSYNEQIQSEAKLLTALKGQRDVKDELVRQADLLQRKTLFTDDAIINGQAILATFTKNEYALKRLTPLMLDYAQAFGVDLNAAAIQVGKTLTNASGVLGKTGLKAEGAAGSSERLAAVIDLLDSKFKGQAEAAIPAEMKAIHELQVATEEFSEAWGKMTLSMGEKASGGISAASVAMNAIGMAIADFKVDNLRDVFRYVTDLIVPVKGLLDVWNTLRGNITEMAKLAAGEKGAAEAIEADRKEIEALAQSLISKGVPAEEAHARATELMKAQLIKARGAADITDEQFKLLTAQITALEPAEVNAGEAVALTDEELKKQADAAKKAAEEMRKLQSESMKRIQGSIKPITTDELIDSGALTEVQAKMLGFYEAVAKNRITGMQLPTEEFQGLDLAMRTTADGMTTFTDKYEKMWVDVQAISEGIQQAFQAVVMSTIDAFSDMISAAVSGEGGFKQIGAGLLGSIGQIMSDLGKQFIIIGGLGEIFAKAVESMQWYVALGAGVALVAAGAVLKGIAKKSAQPQGMAEGGIVPEGFPGDTYPARLTSGEMVIPPKRLDMMMNTQQVVVLETRLKGQDIWLAQKKVNTKMDNYR